MGQLKQSLLLAGDWEGMNGDGRMDKRENPCFATLVLFITTAITQTKSRFSCFAARPKLSAGDSSP